MRRWPAFVFGSGPAPSSTLIVPKTCSTMLRRTRMALGIASRRRCIASITASCSRRVMRRCLLGVHSERGAAGMEPADVTAFVRKNYWPEAPAEAVTPIVWRMWRKDGTLEKHGSRYALPDARRAHNSAEDRPAEMVSDGASS